MSFAGYMRRLFRYRKWLFALAVFCIAAQLFINYKGGLIATPFFENGMFAGPFRVPDTAQAFLFDVDGQPVRLADYDGRVVDNIIGPVDFFLNQSQNGVVLYHTHIRRFLHMFHIPSDSTWYDPTISLEQFKNWYQNYLGNQLNRKVQHFNVYRVTCKIKDNQFIPAKKERLLWK